jgi:uncharacterized membrane protein YgdD (TMEM256/DUF423 family)
MTPAAARRIAAASGFLAVALGAFGAHGLKNLLAQNGTADIWEKAVFYQFVHTVVLFVLAERKVLPRTSWICFLGGVAVFSGSLYLLAATNVCWLGAVTPAGGILLLAGWLTLVCHRSAAD